MKVVRHQTRTTAGGGWLLRQAKEESEVGTSSRNVELEQEEGANRKALRGAGYGAMGDRWMKQEAREQSVAVGDSYTED